MNDMRKAQKEGNVVPSEAKVAARVDALIKRMTLEEKVGQLSQIGGASFAGRPNLEEIIRRGEAGSVHGLTVAEIEEWKERALLGLENSLRSRQKDEQIKELKQKIGEFVIDIDILEEAQKPYLPTTPGTSNE